MTMSKVMGNGGFNGCFIEPQGVSAWWKETTQTSEHQSSKAKLLLPIKPIGIVAYAFTLSWDNLCRNSCIQMFEARLSYQCDCVRHAISKILWVIRGGLRLLD